MRALTIPVARAAIAVAGLLGAALVIFGVLATAGPASAQSAAAPMASPNATDSTLVWRRIRGSAVDIAIGPQGIVYCVDRDGRLWRWRGEANGWTLLPRRFKRVTVGASGKPIAVGLDGLVYRYNGLWWDALGTTKTVDVAAGLDGQVFAVSADGKLISWQQPKQEWKTLGGSGLTRVSADLAGRPLVLDTTNRVNLFEGGEFERLPGEASDIASGPGDAVFIVAPDGTVSRRNLAAGTWEAEAGISAASAIAVGPGGFPWVVDDKGRIFGTADFGPEEPEEKRPPIDLFANSDQRLADRRQVAVILPDVTDVSPLAFTKVPGLADEISIGRDGSVVISDTNAQLFRYSTGEGSFAAYPGHYRKISVTRDGAVYGIDTARNVFLQNGTDQTLIASGIQASEIDVGPEGTLFVTDSQSRVLVYDTRARSFIDTGRLASAIAVDPSGALWGIEPDENRLFRCDTLPCRFLPGPRLSKIDIGPDGSVFVVTQDGRLMAFSRVDESFTLARRDVAEVAVGPRGRPWVIDTDRQVFATTFFQRDESNDDALQAEVFRDSGRVAPSITFTKRYKFSRVDFETSPYAYWLGPDIGDDGTVYVYDQLPGDLDFSWVYDPKKSRMVDVEDPPVPSTTTGMRALAVASNQRVWWLAITDFTFLPRIEVPVGATGYNEVIVPDPGPINPDLAVGGADIAYLVGRSGRLFQFVPTTENFEVRFPETIYRKVSVGPDGLPWVVDADGRILRFDGKKDDWVVLAGGRQRAIDIDVGAGGQAFIVNTDNRLMRYNATNDDFDFVSGVGYVQYVAVDPEGLPWVKVWLDPPAFTSSVLYQASGL